jgi:hypothetical protein
VQPLLMLLWLSLVIQALVAFTVKVARPQSYN